jgi:hypothetical protein
MSQFEPQPRDTPLNGPDGEPEVIEAEVVEAATAVVPTRSLEIFTKAELDAGAAFALINRRPPFSVITQELISMTTFNAQVAAESIYTLKRKGREPNGQYKTKAIMGASIRFAEDLVYAYRNVRVASRAVSNDGRVVVSQGVCIDLERGTHVSTETQRSILTKNGYPFSADMQVVATNANNSIAVRNAILRCVPRAIWIPAYEACMNVVKGDQATLVTRRTDMLKAYAGIGVVEEQILRSLERESVTDIDLDDIATLAGYWTAIKDGQISAQEAFQAPEEPGEGEPPVEQRGAFKDRMRTLKEQRQKRGKK